MKRSVAPTLLFAFTLAPSLAHAQSAVQVPVQGLLTDATGVPLESTLVLTFRIYATQAAAAPLWMEQQTVQVGNLFPGIFTVNLGAITPLADTLFRDNQAPYLGLQVGTDAEMPRWPLHRTPFAAFSNLSGSAGMGSSLPTGAMVLSDVQNDARLTSRGYTSANLTVQAQGPGGQAAANMLTPPDFTAASWVRLASMPRTMLWVPGSVANGRFYVFAGNTSGDPETIEYTPETDSWRYRANIPTQRYAYHCSTLVHANNRQFIHCVGGAGDLRNHDVYDPVNDTWGAGAPLPIGTYCTAGGVYNNEMYIFGGARSGVPIAEVNIYNPTSDSWRTGTPIPSGGRTEHMVGITRGRFYVIGGSGCGGCGNPSNRVDRYNPVDGTWDVPAQAPYAAVDPVIVGIGGRIIMTQGSSNTAGTSCGGGCFQVTWEYNPDTNAWVQRGNVGEGHSFVASGRIGDSIYIAGGEPWSDRLFRYTVPGSAAYDAALVVQNIPLYVYRAP